MKPGDAPFVGPKYPGIEESHKYGPVPPRQGSEREMTGPIYPGVETANKFDVVFIWFFFLNWLSILPIIQF